MNIINQIYICKKYAQAFYDNFYNKLDSEQILKIKDLILFLTKNKFFLLYLQLDFINYNIKKDFIDRLIKQYGLINDFEKLFLLIKKNKHISLLLEILKQILKLYNLKNNFIEFNIVSSSALSEDQLLQLKSFLYKNTQKNIIYKLSTDKSLIAGIKVYSDTLGWEHSIRKQLYTLKNVYKENL